MAYAVILAMILAPALGDWALLLSGKMALVCAFSVASLALQPKFAGSAAVASDRGTAQAFTWILAPYMILTVLEARFLRMPIALEWNAMACSGLVTAATGLGIRTWAVRTLGKFFTLHVQALPDHKVVRNGPYRFVRHPSYTGALLMLIGVPLLIDAWITAVVFGILFCAWTIVRIRQEELVLETALGPEYTAYKKTTPALVPFT